MKDHYSVIKAPVITEKAVSLGEQNQFVFWVDVNANKKTVKEAIESVYSVSVTSVNTQRLYGKFKTQGRTGGRRPIRKKAYVTLKEGDTIELVQGL